MTMHDTTRCTGYRIHHPTKPVARVIASLAALVMGVSALSLPSAAAAQDATADATLLFRGETGQYEVPVNKSGVIRLDRTARRVSVGNPGIVDVLVLRAQEIYVVGKAIGSTNLTAWDESERVFATYNVNVTQDLESLKLSLHKLLPTDKIGVQAAQERIILSGQVGSLARMDAAMKLAQGFLSECVAASSSAAAAETGKKFDAGGLGTQNCKKGEVINLMQIGGTQQVMLQVKVAEVSRSLINRLEGGFNFLKFGKDGVFGLTGNGVSSFPPGTPTAPGAPALVPGLIDRFGTFGSYLGSDYLIQALLDISRSNGLAKILAEPNLTTLSGEEAQFLSGGEFPIPVPSGNGDRVTIEFKDFGVGVKFVPVILDNGHINLKLAVTVSDLATTNTATIAAGGGNNAFIVPSLTKRSASNSVELANGQTIGIAGLISDNVRELVTKFPVLGDIPILGALFRSQEFRHEETELVIFVTPHLAKPIAPSQVKLPTDQFVPPNAFEFYLLGRTESGREPPPTARGNSAEAGTATGTSFGHAQ